MAGINKHGANHCERVQSPHHGDIAHQHSRIQPEQAAYASGSRDDGAQDHLIVENRLRCRARPVVRHIGRREEEDSSAPDARHVVSYFEAISCQTDFEAIHCAFLHDNNRRQASCYHTPNCRGSDDPHCPTRFSCCVDTADRYSTRGRNTDGRRNSEGAGWACEEAVRLCPSTTSAGNGGYSRRSVSQHEPPG
ncbi:hypothetical protein J4E89_004658 [Alternaria sp. Ai002NY15]|nr:hypothetical protein J4E89_004658 [Alternaria sp. Ai002NY15]